MKSKLKSLFFVKSGNKESFNIKNIKIIGGFLFFTTILIQIIAKEDKTIFAKSRNPFIINKKDIKKIIGDKKIEEILNHPNNKNDGDSNSSKKYKTAHSQYKQKNINYNAKQIVKRSNFSNGTSPLPTGTNGIGKLINQIDSRDSHQAVKVILPYGIKHSSGGSIPKESVLIGKVSSSIDSKKFYLTFFKLILKNGEEHKINAHALNSKNFSVGLIGEVHSNIDLRLAGSIGLSMVSAATEVLTTKQSLGQFNQYGGQVVTPKSTMRNALLTGVSKITKEESQRQMQKINQSNDYMTLESGSDLIINLLEPYYGEKI